MIYRNKINPFFLFLLLVFSCTPPQEKKQEKRIEYVQDFDKKELEIKYPNNIEVQKIEEKIEKQKGNKFKIINKFKNELNPSFFYETLELDIENKKCIKQRSRFFKEKDSLEHYKKDTLDAFVEDKTYSVGGVDYLVYRITEKDWDNPMCKATVVSPQFGFLFSKSTIGGFEMAKKTEEGNLKELIRKIREDSSFSSCGY